ncbi:DUF4116 domain-containing protein [Endozoicomonas sp. YOMI1]|uniref:DUF4116 domain-containing protein n=1 Tax=Endozoicomonas sp. YOMI1 TaxID=2828739 RepID=UPI002148F402|nr:DUF4116 domain-containing protein [Endozoicomonas sp. YOMI1]
MNIQSNSSFRPADWQNREVTDKVPNKSPLGDPSGQPWLQYRVKDAPDSSADNGPSPISKKHGSPSIARQSESTFNDSYQPGAPDILPYTTPNSFSSIGIKRPEPSIIENRVSQCHKSSARRHVPVNPCENGSAYFPQGNLSHELKDSLKRYAQCIANGQSLPVSDCKLLIKYFRHVPKNTDLTQLDFEDLPLLIEARPEFFKQIPLDKLTPDLCLRACKIDYKNFQYVPDTMKTDELCRAMALENIHQLRHVPDELIMQWLDDGFFDSLNEIDGYAISFIPEEERTDARFEVSCKNYFTALCYYPKNKPISDKLITTAIERLGSLGFCPVDKITAELCESACNKNGNALRYVPEKMKTPELCQKALSIHLSAFEYIPEAFKTFEICKLYCKNGDWVTELPGHLTKEQRIDLYRTACLYGESLLSSIPEEYVTYDFLKSLCTHKEYRRSPLLFASYFSFSSFVDNDRARELYLLACSLSTDALENVPDIMKNGEFLDIVLKKDISALQHIPSENLDFNGCCLKVAVNKKMITSFKAGTLMKTCKSSEPLLHQLIKSNKLPYVPTGVQLRVLSDPDFPLNDKLRFIESLDAPDYTFPAQVTAAPLVCQKSPVSFAIINLFLMPLVSTAHQATGFVLPNPAAGKRINRYIAEHMPSSFRQQPLPKELRAENGSAIRTVGGRTVQCKTKGDQAVYFKFQRAGEPLDTLAREGLLYKVIAETPELRFESVLPQFRAFMQLPLGDELQCLIGDFDDPVEITESNGQQYINVFSYEAPAAYAHYAHSPATADNIPWQRPEEGILKACHDAGYMTSMGLVPTSMMQCLHDTRSGRGWVALHAAMNEHHNNVYSGTLGAWNTLATEKIDFGHCGMRDLGDYETFGDIQSCLRQKDTLDYCYSPRVSQRIALANSICEIILSAVLVRSRLRQGFAGYHYKNPQAIRETAIFVESACNRFLSGLMSSPPGHLQSLLGRDDYEYQTWLDRVAQEILYWTALQQGEPGFDLLPKGKYDPADCYLNHINDEHLSEALYPVGAYTNISRKDFFNVNGQLNLGANNNTFPLISLMNGLTRMCTGILDRLNQSGGI